MFYGSSRKNDQRENHYFFFRNSRQKGWSNVKKYIEFLEASGIPRKKELSPAIIKKLSDELNKSATEKFKKAKGF